MSAQATETNEIRALTKTAKVEPGKIHEACTKLLPAESLEYRFSADVALDFNIHYHRGKDVIYPVKRDAITTDAGIFKPAQSEDFCLMWKNTSTGAVELRYTYRVRS